MSPLYLYDGKLLLRDNKLAESVSCCCDCPRPVDRTVSLSDDGPTNGASISGVFYLFSNGAFSKSLSGGPGFPACVVSNYSCFVTINSGSIDDYGSIAGVFFQNNIDTCGQTGPSVPTPRITTIDSPVTVGVGFTAKGDGTFVVPIYYTAINAPNCRGRLYIRASLTFNFV